MMEQTFWLDSAEQQQPETCPLRLLEQMTGRRLVRV